ncbi:diguanylate cyclase [Undibacterium sp.]|uniref:GGDEF domain-containing protein n=1 Tax=Undibacterium sp. TaxID=1914977 RepID=UPI0025DB17E8|nr:diguanylate cyclase [Undibacterium sp.]
MKQIKLPVHSSYDPASNDEAHAFDATNSEHRLGGSLWQALTEAGRHQPSVFLYALYLLSLILLKFDYNGHQLSFLWTKQEWSLYGMLALMVGFSCSCLLVASHFLQLQRPPLAVSQVVQVLSNIGLSIVLVYVALGRDRAAANVGLFLLALWLGYRVLIALRCIASLGAIARYFFLATLASFVVAGVCAVVALNHLPLNAATYQALELALIAELTFLGLALAQQARRHQFAGARAMHLACHDSLTGLYNRRAFLEMAKPVWSNAQRNQRPISMIMIDLDHFKRINDQHGHDAGDRALQASAELIEQACRAGDLLSRWGGEEFLILLPETDMDQACLFAERVRASLEALGLPVESKSIMLTASFGVAGSADKDSLEDLIKAADLRLYDAKTQGRNRISSEHCLFYNSVLQA